MKIQLRSNTVTQGRKMAGARSLFQAAGMQKENFGKPIVAVVNSFTQFVPGHAHLHTVGQNIKAIIEKEGCFAPEFNTIAVDDGIAMGHSGMLYSLPSRDLIADSIEYMINAHKADAMICITNCDKITPGMLMASMRLNIPTIFVSGGPMEAGMYGDTKVDLVDVMVKGADKNFPEEELLKLEQSACPSCGSCSGMFTANSMNILCEAIGMALPGNGTLPATHFNRQKLFAQAARQIVKNTFDYYQNGNEKVLPRNIFTKQSLVNALTVDIAMGGSTNTILHLLAIAHEAKVDFSMKEIDDLSRKTPCICKVSPNSHYHIEDVNRAGGVLSIMGELLRKNYINGKTYRVDRLTTETAVLAFDITRNTCKKEAAELYLSGTVNVTRTNAGENHENYYAELDTNREKGCIRNIENAYSKDGGLAILTGNIAKSGCVVKTAGVDESILKFKGKAIVFESQEDAVNGILSGKVKEGNVVVIRYEGPKGGPGMQEMLYPTSYLKSMGLDKKCALITDGRFSGGTSGLSVGHVSPEAAAKGDIALIANGDEIFIDIPNRNIELLIEEQKLQTRKAKELNRGNMAYKPKKRKREISQALKFYAAFVSSADKGAVRIIND